MSKQKQTTLFQSWGTTKKGPSSARNDKRPAPGSGVIDLCDEEDDADLLLALQESLKEAEKTAEHPNDTEPQPGTSTGQSTGLFKVFGTKDKSNEVIQINSNSNSVDGFSEDSNDIYGNMELAETNIPQATNIEDLPGYDLMAGRLWIYPTNYPVREYQYNIVQSALFNNTMVVLPTGLGKTFIAAVVMYNLYKWYPQGKVIFMAPTKPLVAQQIEACYNIMGVPQEDTAEMTGAMNPTERKKAWLSKRVFFLTPQVLTNDLSRTACPADSIRCLVVDEAHRATGNHSYCQVVRELIKYNDNFRVLALTATPGSDIKAVQQVITNLLVSHIELRSEDSADIKRYSFERKVDKVVVPLGEVLTKARNKYLQIMTIVVMRLRRMGVLYNREPKSLSKFLILKAREAFRQDPPRNLQRSQFGMVEGDFALCMSLYHGYDLLQQHGLRSLFNFLDGILTGDKGYGRTKTELMKNADFRELMESLRSKFHFIKAADPSISCSQVAPMSASQLATPAEIGHPKMVKLREIVLEHFKKYHADGLQTRIMIFSQFRDSVNEITDILNRHRPTVKAMSFIGQSSAGKSSKGFTQKEQLKVMKDFREGGYNTLISTCVGEEGLDIGDVDLIVCFDAHKSPIRLVQRMGRTGRKRSGRIVMLVTEGKEEQMYNQSQCSKRSIHKAIENGTKSLQYYPRNPRMVPEGLNPQCHKMHITVQNDYCAQSAKGKAPASKPAANSTLMAGSSKTSARSKSRAVNRKDGYLTEEELKYWNDHYKVDEKSVAVLPSTEMLCLSKGKSPKKPRSKEREQPLLSLTDWLPWQNRLQHYKYADHSTQSKHLVEILEFMDIQSTVGGDEDNYGLEMQTYLNEDDIIRPGRNRQLGILKYCTPTNPNPPKSKVSKKKRSATLPEFVVDKDSDDDSDLPALDDVIKGKGNRKESTTKDITNTNLDTELNEEECIKVKKKKKRKKLSSECSLKSQHSETSPTNAAVIKPIQDVDENDDFDDDRPIEPMPDLPSMDALQTDDGSNLPEDQPIVPMPDLPPMEDAVENDVVPILAADGAMVIDLVSDNSQNDQGTHTAFDHKLESEAIDSDYNTENNPESKGDNKHFEFSKEEDITLSQLLPIYHKEISREASGKFQDSDRNFHHTLKNGNRKNNPMVCGVRTPPPIEEISELISDLDRKETLSPVDILDLVDQWEKEKVNLKDSVSKKRLSFEKRSMQNASSQTYSKSGKRIGDKVSVCEEVVRVASHCKTGRVLQVQHNLDRVGTSDTSHKSQIGCTGNDSTVECLAKDLNLRSPLKSQVIQKSMFKKSPVYDLNNPNKQNQVSSKKASIYNSISVESKSVNSGNQNCDENSKNCDIKLTGGDTIPGFTQGFPSLDVNEFDETLSEDSVKTSLPFQNYTNGGVEDKFGSKKSTTTTVEDNIGKDKHQSVENSAFIKASKLMTVSPKDKYEIVRTRISSDRPNSEQYSEHSELENMESDNHCDILKTNKSNTHEVSTPKHDRKTSSTNIVSTPGLSNHIATSTPVLSNNKTKDAVNKVQFTDDSFFSNEDDDLLFKDVHTPFSSNENRQKNNSVNFKNVEKQDGGETAMNRSVSKQGNLSMNTTQITFTQALALVHQSFNSSHSNDEQHSPTPTKNARETKNRTDSTDSLENRLTSHSKNSTSTCSISDHSNARDSESYDQHRHVNVHGAKNGVHVAEKKSSLFEDSPVCQINGDSHAYQIIGDSPVCQINGDSNQSDSDCSEVFGSIVGPSQVATSKTENFPKIASDNDENGISSKAFIGKDQSNVISPKSAAKDDIVKDNNDQIMSRKGLGTNDNTGEIHTVTNGHQSSIASKHIWNKEENIHVENSKVEKNVESHHEEDMTEKCKAETQPQFDLGFDFDEDFEEDDDVIPPSPIKSTQPFASQLSAKMSLTATDLQTTSNPSPGLIGGLGVKFKTPENSTLLTTFTIGNNNRKSGDLETPESGSLGVKFKTPENSTLSTFTIGNKNRKSGELETPKTNNGLMNLKSNKSSENNTLLATFNNGNNGSIKSGKIETEGKNNALVKSNRKSVNSTADLNKDTSKESGQSNKDSLTSEENISCGNFDDDSILSEIMQDPCMVMGDNGSKKTTDKVHDPSVSDSDVSQSILDVNAKIKSRNCSKEVKSSKANDFVWSSKNASCSTPIARVNPRISINSNHNHETENCTNQWKNHSLTTVVPETEMNLNADINEDMGDFNAVDFDQSMSMILINEGDLIPNSVIKNAKNAKNTGTNVSFNNVKPASRDNIKNNNTDLLTSIKGNTVSSIQKSDENSKNNLKKPGESETEQPKSTKRRRSSEDNATGYVHVLPKPGERETEQPKRRSLSTKRRRSSEDNAPVDVQVGHSMAVWQNVEQPASKKTRVEKPIVDIADMETLDVSVFDCDDDLHPDDLAALDEEESTESSLAKTRVEQPVVAIADMETIDVSAFDCDYSMHPDDLAVLGEQRVFDDEEEDLDGSVIHVARKKRTKALITSPDTPQTRNGTTLDDSEFKTPLKPAPKRRRQAKLSSSEDEESPVLQNKHKTRINAKENSFTEQFQSDDDFEGDFEDDFGVGIRHSKQDKQEKCGNRKKKKKCGFIEDEADLSSDEHSGSSDENENSDDNHYDASFVNDATQFTQQVSEVDMRAVYMRSVQSPALGSGGRFKLNYDYARNIDVFSQMPGEAEQDETYQDDSFCVGSQYDESEYMEATISEHRIIDNPRRPRSTRNSNRDFQAEVKRKLSNAKLTKDGKRKRIRKLCESSSSEEEEEDRNQTVHVGTKKRKLQISSSDSDIVSPELLQPPQKHKPSATISKPPKPADNQFKPGRKQFQPVENQSDSVVNRFGQDKKEQKPVTNKFKSDEDRRCFKSIENRLNPVPNQPKPVAIEPDELSQSQGFTQIPSLKSRLLHKMKTSNNKFETDKSTSHSSKINSGMKKPSSASVSEPVKDENVVVGEEGADFDLSFDLGLSDDELLGNTEESSTDNSTKCNSGNSSVNRENMHENNQHSSKRTSSDIVNNAIHNMKATGNHTSTSSCNSGNSSKTVFKENSGSSHSTVKSNSIIPSSIHGLNRTTDNRLSSPNLGLNTESNSSYSNHSVLQTKTSPTQGLSKEDRLRIVRLKQEEFKRRQQKQADVTRAGDKTDGDVTILDYTLPGSSRSHGAYTSPMPNSNTSLITSIIQPTSPGNDKLTVFVDSREINGAQDVISTLRARYKYSTVVTQLQGCDYILSNRMAVERKSVSDFTNGANRKKLVERVKHMSELFERPVLVVEKDRVKPGEKDMQKPMLKSKYVEMMLASLNQMQIKVYFSESQEHTAEVLSQLIETEKSKRFTVHCKAQLTQGQEQRMKFYLSLPKVSFTTALNFVHGYSTLREFIKSPKGVLERRGHINKNKAQEIHYYLQHKFSPHMLGINKTATG